MKKAIYKIENLINHKVYIGQSINPEKRFNSHCWNREKYISLINRAIKKYGKENFSFEILGWFENYNEKEKYYIQFFRCLSPNGYNIAEGGENPPLLKGENNPFAKITEETAKKIIKDLLNFKIQRRQIAKKYNVSYDIIRHIIEGDSWKDENLSYPLRPPELQLNKQRAEKIIDLLKNTTMTHKEIGKTVGWNRSAVTMINNGKNWYNPELEYPIRK